MPPGRLRVGGSDQRQFDAKMSALLEVIGSKVANPIVVHVIGDTIGKGIVKIFIVGTLPSGKIGGVYTVSIET